MIKFNFGYIDQSKLPRLVHTGLDTDHLAESLAMLPTLVQSGVLTPTDSDEQVLRDLFGLNELPEDSKRSSFERAASNSKSSGAALLAEQLIKQRKKASQRWLRRSRKELKHKLQLPPKIELREVKRILKDQLLDQGEISKYLKLLKKLLSNMRDEHNEKYKAQSKRVDLGMLKAVYRRGAGAFSSSHRPNVSSREQWALARVKAFLKLVGTGERKKAYNTDLDLLPKGHPQKTEKKAELLNIPDRYSHIDFIPPKAAAEAAERALRIRSKKPPSQRGGTEVGLARARDLVNRKRLSPEDC